MKCIGTSGGRGGENLWKMVGKHKTGKKRVIFSKIRGVLTANFRDVCWKSHLSILLTCTKVTKLSGRSIKKYFVRKAKLFFCI